MKQFFPILVLALLVFGCGNKSEKLFEDTQLMTSQIIVGDLDWIEIIDFPVTDPIRVNSRAVGDVSIPSFGARCTGFMITKDVLMTNEHCVPGPSYASGIKVAFEHEKGRPRSQWSEYSCETFLGNDSELDFALLKCSGSPGDVFGTVKLVSQEVQVDTQLYVVQQNCDYYYQSGCDWSKKVSFGKVVKIDSEVVHNADTLGGSSGSPVFSKDTHKVIAIHHAGRGNNGLGRGIENYAVPMSKIVPFLEVNYPEVYAQLGDDDGDDFDDMTEENDSFESAFLVEGQKTFSQVKIASQEDVDFYKFTFSQTGSLKARIDFSHTSGDLDMKIYDSSYTQLASSTSVKDFESLEVSGVKGQVIYIKVYGYSKATGDYGLSLELESENNSFETAQILAFPTSSYADEVKGQSEFFKLSLSSTKEVSIQIEFDHLAGDLDLYLYDEGGALVSRSISVTSIEKISRALFLGKYFIEVRGYKGALGKFKLNIN